MSVFNNISWPAFILSFAIGVFYIYISLPKQRVVIVYPTQDNADHFVSKRVLQLIQMDEYGIPVLALQFSLEK